jgi:RNA polymerase sigma-70 factor (ECF subfamily)
MFLQRIFGTNHFSVDGWARLYSESGAADLAVSRDEFAEMLQDVLSRSEHATGQTQAELIKSLRLNDLVLARACARGDATAWDLFLTRYREKLYAAGAAIARDEVRGRELADSLYAELYGTRRQPDGKRVSKLDSFLGRGSLEGWLKTILAQQYVNRFRQERKLIAFDDALETPSQIGVVDPVSPIRQMALQHATDAALTDLPAEDRLLLAAYYLDQRTLAEIGRMLGIHESTISRRLDRITARLRKHIIGRLCKGGMPKRAAEELLALDVRDLEINVREKLAQERRA